MARIIDDENQKNIVGSKVKQLRREQHMSQQELSAKLETLAVYICRGSISRIEDGSRTVSDIELYGLSQVFDTPIEEFFQ
ncbi:MAG: helix-turn-helix domain-containing protein [Lachnospiraceae bacterium]|nr:helix-turn-helix domain-containing protein [Lachnospiraceae bacterium]